MNISINNVTTLTMILAQFSEPNTITIHYLVLGTAANGTEINKIIERDIHVPTFRTEHQRIAFAASLREEVRLEFLKKGALVTVYAISPNLI